MLFQKVLAVGTGWLRTLTMMWVFFPHSCAGDRQMSHWWICGWVWSPSSTLQAVVPITGVVISTTANCQTAQHVGNSTPVLGERGLRLVCVVGRMRSALQVGSVVGNLHCHCMLPWSTLFYKWAVSVPEAVSLVPFTASVFKHIVKYRKGIMSFTFLIEITIFLLTSMLNWGYPKFRLYTRVGKCQGVLFQKILLCLTTGHQDYRICKGTQKLVRKNKISRSYPQTNQRVVISMSRGGYAISWLTIIRNCYCGIWHVTICSWKWNLNFFHANRNNFLPYFFLIKNAIEILREKFETYWFHFEGMLLNLLRVCWSWIISFS